jgi:hypothetical protein
MDELFRASLNLYHFIKTVLSVQQLKTHHFLEFVNCQRPRVIALNIPVMIVDKQIVTELNLPDSMHHVTQYVVFQPLFHRYSGPTELPVQHQVKAAVPDR